MYYYSANFGNGDELHSSSDKFLHINNAGYYKDIRPNVGSNRPYGLSDWQIIYVYGGEMEHKLNGVPTSLKGGDIIIYPPDHPQVYRCVGDLTSYAWIHFSGTAVNEIIKEASFTPLEVFHAEVSERPATYIYQLIEELRSNRPAMELKSSSLFLKFLTFLSRILKSENKASSKYEKVLPAIRDIEKTPYPHKTNEEYAQLCGLDSYYFIHLFKDVTGLSPIKYASDISMRKAGSLIIETNMDVLEIAESLGFVDPCYFGRKFKKFFDLTPSEYRRKHRAIEANPIK